ncbi:MAG: hypothetical protein HFJ46_02795 [Clostridia bacterium]|jgi:hypothetical protein|nr:hypothetical protein [Clostridia bacterium]
MNYGDGNGFGDGNGAWWIIIFLIFALGGFGNGGFGRQGGSGAMEGYVLTSDFANLERKLDGINNGICDSTFALNNTINSGFNGVNVAVLQSANATERGFCNLSAQIAECCCGIKSEIAGINYNMAMNTNTLQQTLCSTTRDIIENQNANYRAIHDELIANKIEAKNERIAEQQAQITALQLKASQEAQNAYLLSELKPCPSAAYIVPNPNCCYNYTVSQNTCGCNCGNY